MNIDGTAERLKVVKLIKAAFVRAKAKLGMHKDRSQNRHAGIKEDACRAQFHCVWSVANFAQAAYGADPDRLLKFSNLYILERVAEAAPFKQRRNGTRHRGRSEGLE